MKGTIVSYGERVARLVAVHPERPLAKIKVGKQVQVVELDKLATAGIRDCVIAPPGKRVVVVDSSGIELRTAHMVTGQVDTIEKIRAGVKIYEDFASDLYGYPVNKHDHPRERNHGKVGMLQLQYQAGAKSFIKAARAIVGIELTIEEAEQTVGIYRHKFRMIKAFWRRCEEALAWMYSGHEACIDDYGLCWTAKHKIIMPGGLELVYSGLHQRETEFGRSWVYYDKEERKEKFIYGGMVFENINQCLARLIVFDQTAELEKRWGKNPDTGVVMSVHDEAGIIVDAADAEACLADSLKVFSTPPAWWPDIPLDAEGGIGIRYGAAK